MTPRELMRDKLRAEAPELAAFVDSLRAEFGEIKITYLCICAVEFGSKSTRPIVRPTDATPALQLREDWYRINMQRRAAGGRV